MSNRCVVCGVLNTEAVCIRCEAAFPYRATLGSATPAEPRGDGEEALVVIFDGPPCHECGRFVEVETTDGRSVRAGEWRKREDGLWALGPFFTTKATLRGKRLEAALREVRERVAQTRTPLPWEGRQGLLNILDAALAPEPDAAPCPEPPLAVGGNGFDPDHINLPKCGRHAEPAQGGGSAVDCLLFHIENGEFGSAVEQAKEIGAEVERLRGLLREAYKRAAHGSGCGLIIKHCLNPEGDYSCTCGLDDLLRDIRAALDGGELKP